MHTSISLVIPKDTRISRVIPKDAHISQVIPKDAHISLVISKDAHISRVIPKDAHISQVIPKDAHISLVIPKDAHISRGIPKDTMPVSTARPYAQTTHNCSNITTPLTVQPISACEIGGLRSLREPVDGCLAKRCGGRQWLAHGCNGNAAGDADGSESAARRKRKRKVGVWRRSRPGVVHRKRKGSSGLAWRGLDGLVQSKPLFKGEREMHGCWSTLNRKEEGRGSKMMVAANSVRRC
ncbi:Adhesive plaque matrix protein [Cucumis melo var. makuwa]|uniref:Adhesive plaque matrix protein n=1 Tax=Cucumis melo var. makuwa TaxID=1194695 RepID=A0A5A7VEB6_CUCMM|nr:Adhesive plaque matrix protein [Cucumis melo var. makuwa]